MEGAAGCARSSATGQTQNKSCVRLPHPERPPVDPRSCWRLFHREQLSPHQRSRCLPLIVRLPGQFGASFASNRGPCALEASRARWPLTFSLCRATEFGFCIRPTSTHEPNRSPLVEPLFACQLGADEAWEFLGGNRLQRSETNDFPL